MFTAPLKFLPSFIIWSLLPAFAPEVNIKTLLAGGPRPSGIPLVGPHSANRGLPSLCLPATLPTSDPFVSYITCFLIIPSVQPNILYVALYKNSTLLSLETAAIFSSPLYIFNVYNVHLATEENSYQLGEQMREKHPQTRYPAKCHSLVAAVTFLPLLSNPFFLSYMKSCMLQQPSLNGRRSV